jgi:hypothetical protein
MFRINFLYNCQLQDIQSDGVSLLIRALFLLKGSLLFMLSNQFSKNCKLKNTTINLDYLAILLIKFFKILKSKFLQI